MTRSSRSVPAVLALLIAVLLAGGVATVVGRSGEPRVAQTSVVAVVAELQTFVESARGLPFLEPVDVSVLGREAFRRELSVGAPERVDTAVQEAVLRAFGLLDEGEDLRRAAELDPDSVAGFYDTGTKQLVVRGSRLSPFVRQVLVHELTHALDDQHFGLDGDLADFEALLAYEALAEGDAVVVESRYLESLSPSERADADAEAETTFGRAGSLHLPAILLELGEFAYRDGPVLVRALLEEGGRARLDAALRSPPTTTAEVLHPERFLAGRRQVGVAPPLAAGPVIDDGPLGELVLRAILAGSVPGDEAERAADGWAGGRYVAWSAGRQTCVRATVAVDSQADAGELQAALRQWARDHPGATAAPAGATVVTLGRCA